MKIFLRKIRLNEKQLKITLFLFSILILLALITTGIYTITTSSSYCIQCHEMKPEYYTWQASSHNRFKCTTCHLEPGIKNIILYQKWAIEEWYQHLSDKYYSPIIMPKLINNVTCNRCHDMNERKVTPNGDIIIPHKRHEENGIKCTKCHGGIAHGSIASRQVTYSSDYQDWDKKLGKNMMANREYVRPTMEMCIDCHKVRNGPLKCRDCHSTGLFPDTHKSRDFKNGYHGKLAAKDLAYCNNCHRYSTKEKIEGLEKEPKYKEYLAKGKSKKIVITVEYYAKNNTFCKDCHSKKPKSHQNIDFELNHGKDSKINIVRCMTCHEYNPDKSSMVVKTACNGCHPSTHDSGDWQKGHPIDLPQKPRITNECYTCHNQEMCSSCHKVVN